jgi:hypothetical protein
MTPAPKRVAGDSGGKKAMWSIFQLLKRMHDDWELVPYAPEGNDLIEVSPRNVRPGTIAEVFIGGQRTFFKIQMKGGDA